MNRSLLVSSLLGLAALACGVAPSTEALATSTPALLAHCPPAVPPELAVGPGEALWRDFPAEGVQIYVCTATGWVFESPDALLLKADSDDGEGDPSIVGHHFAGPTWEYKDHSSVVGARVAGAPAPVAGAIPWLLLKATANGPQGRFSQVTSIQRLDTTGGVAPATGCDATTLGAKARVPYTATYYFYRAAERGKQACR